MRLKKRILIVLPFCLFLFLTCSCRQHKTGSNLNEATLHPLISVKYAKGFTLEYHKDYKVLEVFNPWQSAQGMHYKYILIPKGKNIKENFGDAEIIRTPVQRIVCMSTTHIGLIDLIDKTSTIVGISGTNLVNNQKLRYRIDHGQIPDVGYEQSLNYERILSLKPDLVMTYGVGGDILNYVNKFHELGIKVVFNAEYLESSPLAKAEWVKFMSAFYDEEIKADRQFKSIEKEYIQLAGIARKAKTSPTVLCGLPWKDKWYVPGGDSYLATLIRDAGANYLWSDNPSRESFPLDIETVYNKASHADYWINSGAANSLNEILSVDPRLENFKAAHYDRVFNNNAILNVNGGNDYWESGIIHPQVILKDLIKIFHPELLPGYSLVYYKQLK
ncbi:MAG: ABC transporter substrate-binding protein [Bacteroidota bacterium]|nr:ABC transporter substrate-binding protein [Bacteroidota bacterium]